VLEEPAPASPKEQAVVVDAMGGDNGPAVIVAGAAAAAAVSLPVILDPVEATSHHGAPKLSLPWPLACPAAESPAK